MTFLTGGDAIRARDGATRISASAITQSPWIEGMYRMPDGRIAEHHVEYYAHHRLLIYTDEEARAIQNVPLHRHIM